MRSRALQALGPLRPSSPSLRHLRHIHRPASRAPTTTPRPAIRQAAPITSTTRARAAKPSPPPPSQQFVDPEASTPEGVPAADIDVALSSGSSLAGENPPAASPAFGEAISASSIPPAPDAGGGPAIDWSSSFHGLSTAPFEARVAETLMRSLDPEDVEVKPDGIIYLPEIKYRRILNAAFGPGGWGLAPRGELAVGDKVVTREYALIVHGR